ncbi:ATP-binding protein [Haloferula sargassicola]
MRLLLFVLVLLGARTRAGAETLTLAELERRVEACGVMVASFSVEGTVCGAGERWMVLRDDSGAVAVELPEVKPEWVPGVRLRISGNECCVVRGKQVIEVGTAPVIDNDGHHSRWERSVSIHLDEGPHPFRLEYFNGLSEGALELEIEGPGLPRQTVPEAFYGHHERGRLVPGLVYRAYEGKDWPGLPEFSALPPTAGGIAAEPGIGLLTRAEHAALVFSGRLLLPRQGDYTFFLSSDDGSKLWLGPEGVETELLAGAAEHEPQAEVNDRWVTMEGSVTFAAREDHLLMLELQGRGGTTEVVVDDRDALEAAALPHQRVVLSGLARQDGLLVVDAGDVQVLGAEESAAGRVVEIGQIRRLQPDEASQARPVTVSGVITMAAPEFLVIQDPTGGVYVRYASRDSVGHPRVGECWEIDGVTDPGDFSPMLRGAEARYGSRAPLPEPARPSWEQIVSGGLDAEMVELEGAIVSAGEHQMVLLTRDGDLTLNFSRFYPPPYDPADEAAMRSLAGSVVRLRGVFTATWAWNTGQVIAGNIYLGNARMSIEAAASDEPFEAPRMKAADLLLFTSHTSRFRRVRVPGTLLSVQAPELFVTDGTAAFRAVCEDTADLAPGDRIEVAGFPRLGGPSPVLMDARIRRTGKGPLPPPEPVSPSDLPDPTLDASRVELVATVLSDSPRERGRVLELRSGGQRFVVRMPEASKNSKALGRDSTVKVAGVYVAASSPRAEPFELLVGHAADLTVLQRGPWWTTRHTVMVLATLTGALLLALGWVHGLRRTVAHRSRQLAEEIEGRQRVERHREMERERTRVARDLHDELGSKLTEAGILTSLIKRRDLPEAKKSDYLNRLDGVCHGLVTGLDEIVWAVNPAYDSVTDLAGYFSMFAQRFLELAGIRCRLNIERSTDGHPLEAARRHDLFLAFKEALTNVVRHSGAAEVKLKIGVEDGWLEVAIADDGCGFEEGNARPGSDGLAGMKGRMEGLGGVCFIESGPGRGTTVRFRLKLNPENE